MSEEVTEKKSTDFNGGVEQLSLLWQAEIFSTSSSSQAWKWNGWGYAA